MNNLFTLYFVNVIMIIKNCDSNKFEIFKINMGSNKSFSKCL